ncbi:uncharacterized protein LOC121795566 isoform X1 [Salvia splendens]|uniref:uncharacterized protein LOC121795566 isoform X1 n=1 Tax=Salvia splendens TaxID=180675 RepID=UPI001C25A78D|nr:uncharacterized protein LOC121795566 isoform X1 [Salvia splendens]XP_042050032.1 uncharacterized protein LOC121795566 isoform X1 [Salvia splendens]
MSGHQAQEKYEVKASSSKGVENIQCSSIFGQFSEKEIITQLKGLARNPSMPQFAIDNIQPLWTQILGLRKLMALEASEMPWRKRKLEQLVKDTLRAPAGFVSPHQQNMAKCRRRQSSQASSSLSCLLNSIDSAHSHDDKFIFESLVTFDEAFPEKQVTTECSFADDVVDLKCTSKDVSPVVDSDESVNVSNPSNIEDSSPNVAHHLAISKVVRNLNLPTLSGTQRKHLEPSHRSISLLNFIGDHLQRKVIPVGPRFQTDIPEWDDTVDMSIRISSYKSDSDNLKWLGSQVWPIVTRNMKSTRREIGKGKNIFCSCASRASADCIKRLVCEDRLLLQHDLGPAFSSWKFDEMGEQVSESWSLKEQRAYESLMKMRPSANGKSFWKRTLKRLPRKSKKDIVNYYFNVYIPHRMSLHRSSPTINQVDTDDEDEDEADNSDHKGLQKGAEGRSPTIPNKKARYLRTS